MPTDAYERKGELLRNQREKKLPICVTLTKRHGNEMAAGWGAAVTSPRRMPAPAARMQRDGAGSGRAGVRNAAAVAAARRMADVGAPPTPQPGARGDYGLRARVLRAAPGDGVRCAQSSCTPAA